MKRKDKHSAPEAEEAAVSPEAAPAEPAAEEWTPEPPKTEPDLAEKLAGEITNLKQKLLYLEADYQNYRKRTAKDVADARAYGAAGTIDPFITVFEFLGMAKGAAEKSENIESIRQGLYMIIGEFNKAFEELGVKRLELVGKPFDPAVAEAVAHEPSETIPEGIVMKEWSGAFKLGERLLRAARVVVSSGAPKAPEAVEE